MQEMQKAGKKEFENHIVLEQRSSLTKRLKKTDDHNSALMETRNPSAENPKFERQGGGDNNQTESISDQSTEKGIASNGDWGSDQRE